MIKFNATWISGLDLYILISRTDFRLTQPRKSATPSECQPYMQAAMRVHVLLSAYVTVACTMLVVYSREDVASFFAVFFICPSIPPHLSRRTRTSLPFSFAFIKYKQFHTFCPTPERPAEHIFMTRHSGFCQLSSAPAPHHPADSPL